MEIAERPSLSEAFGMFSDDSIMGNCGDTRFQSEEDSIAETENELELVLEDECSHDGAFEMEKCPHCEKAFCEMCKFSHFESLQTETKWLFSSLAPRLNLTVNTLPLSASRSKEVISDKLQKARAKVRRQTEEMIQQLRCKETEWLNIIDAHEHYEIASVDRFVGKCRSVSTEVRVLGRELRRRLGMSLLMWTLDQTASLNESVRSLDQKICEMENFVGNYNKFSCKVDFKDLQTVLKRDILIECSNKIFLSTFPQQSTEQLRLTKAVNNGVKGIEDFFEMHDHIPSSVVNGEDGKGKTALARAARRGDLESVRYLVDTCGADIFRQDNSAIGDMPIHAAARFDKVEIVKYFVELDTNCLNLPNNEGKIPLIIAFERDCLEVVTFLLEFQNADIEPQAINSLLPLAVAKNHLVLVRYLIEKANDDPYANVSSSSYHILIRLAVEYKRSDVLRYLASKYPQQTVKWDEGSMSSFEMAAYNGYVKGFKVLARSNPAYVKANVSAFIIRAAARGGSVKMGRLLVRKYRAEVDVCSEGSGYAPIHYAIMNNHADFVALLLGVNPGVKTLNCSTPPYETPAAMAERLGFERIQELLKYGV